MWDAEVTARRPVRVDHLIQRQNPWVEQAAAELVSNSLDAIRDDGVSIGHKGVGWKQVLQELRCESDEIIVETAHDGQAIGIRLFKQGEDLFALPIESRLRAGTTIEIRTPLSIERQQKLKQYLIEKFRTNTSAPIQLNGQVINPLSDLTFWNGEPGPAYAYGKPVRVEVTQNGYKISDLGAGMNSRQFVERFLAPERTDKKAKPGVKVTPKAYGRERPEALQTLKAAAKIRLQPVGHLTEEITTAGVNLPAEFILDLPPDCWVPESRNELALDEAVARSIEYTAGKILADQSVSPQAKAQYLNALAVLTRRLGERGASNVRLETVLGNLKGAVQQSGLTKAADAVFVPNREEYLDLALPAERRVIYLDAALFDFSLAGIGAVSVKDVEPGQCREFYTVPMKDKRVWIRSGSRILINAGYYERYKTSPWLFNLLFNFDVYGAGIRKLGKLLAGKPEAKPAEMLDPGEQEAVALLARAEARVGVFEDCRAELLELIKTSLSLNCPDLENRVAGWLAVLKAVPVPARESLKRVLFQEDLTPPGHQVQSLTQTKEGDVFFSTEDEGRYFVFDERGNLRGNKAGFPGYVNLISDGKEISLCLGGYNYFLSLDGKLVEVRDKIVFDLENFPDKTIIFSESFFAKKISLNKNYLKVLLTENPQENSNPEFPKQLKNKAGQVIGDPQGYLSINTIETEQGVFYCCYKPDKTYELIHESGRILGRGRKFSNIKVHKSSVFCVTDNRLYRRSLVLPEASLDSPSVSALLIRYPALADSGWEVNLTRGMKNLLKSRVPADEQERKVFLALAPLLDQAVLEQVNLSELAGYADLLGKMDLKEIAGLLDWINQATIMWQDNSELLNRVLSRALLLYQSNPRRALKMFNLLTKTYEVKLQAMASEPKAPRFLDSAIFGWEFINSEHQVPGELRFLEFLTAEQIKLCQVRKAEHAPAEAKVNYRLPQIPLARLLLAKQERETQVNKHGLTLAEFGRILETVSEYSEEEINGELLRITDGQDRVEQIWLREVAGQNTVDAIIEAEAAGETFPKRKAEIEHYLVEDESGDRGYEVAAVRDPVGMSLHRIINFLLSPNDSSKQGKDFLVGDNGRAFYTLFADFDEVRLTTSTGNGRVHYVCFKAERDDQGELIGINLTGFEERWGRPENKVTRIEKIKYYDRSRGNFTEINAVFVEDAVYRYLGYVGGVEITFQGKPFQIKRQKAAAVAYGQGEVALFFSQAGAEAVTQNDLYVRELDGFYTELVPEQLKSVFSRERRSIDLPRWLKLVRTRNDVANLNQHGEPLQKAVALAHMKAAVKLFFEQGRNTVPGLPEDYLYSNYIGLNVAEEIREDADKINQGNYQEVDFAKYQADNFALTKLMALLNVEFSDGTCASLSDLRQQTLGRGEQKIDGEILDPRVQRRVEEARKVRGIVPTPAHDAVTAAAQARALKTLSPDDQESFIVLSQIIVKAMGKFYDTVAIIPANGNDEEVCAFNPRSNEFRWHVNCAETIALLEKWANLRRQPEVSAEQLETFFYKLMDYITHELAHFGDFDWTHQADSRYAGGFAWRQERLIESLIAAGFDSQKIFQEAISA